MALNRDAHVLRKVAAQAGWVRRLAVELARDVHAGEDVAQDALLTAARCHPQPESLSAWLAGAVRNLARLRLRSEDRRETRERRSARLERVDDPTLVLERLELQEALLGAVRGLPEPYRTTVLLRWFEELGPEEIARRTKTPVRTVHTRLSRARALLRETLDRRSQGDRSRWLAAWLPVLSKSSPGWKWVLLMQLKTKLALAGLAAAAALTLWITTGPKGDVDPLPDAQSALTRDPLEASAPAREPVNSAEPTSAERAPVPGAEAQHGESAPAVARRTLFGVVIDVGGVRLAGIPVVFRGEPSARATSDAQGVFAIEVAADGQLDVEAPGWVSVYDTSVELPDPVEGYCLVLAHPCTIAGYVRNGAGEPVAHAQVLFGTMEQGRFDFLSRYSDPLRKRLGLGLEPSTLRSWTTASRADGSFELQAARIPGLPIRASHPAYQSAETDMPEGDQPVTLVLLRSDQPQPNVLPGRVVDLHGKPVHGACLRFGESSARSDEHGKFAIRVDGQGPGARLLAIHCDWEPVVQACLSSSPTDPGAWPDPLLLVMREPVAGIGGVVRDPEGNPVKDVEVLPLDPPSWNEYLGRIGESAIEGGEASDVVLGYEMARTGEDGRFHIRGLAGRSYRLLARNKRTLEALVSDPIPGGTKDALLVIGGSEGRSRFAGVIVDLQQKPIPGAELSGIRTLSDGTRIETDWVRADEQGRFEMPDVSAAIEGFLVWPEMGPGEIVRLDPAAPRDAQRLQVGRIARVCVRIQTPGLAVDTLVFLDSSGTPLACGTKVGRGGWMGGGDSAAIDGSQSDVLIVSERAQVLLLKSKGKEVQRVPLRLDPAQVNLVRP